MQRCETNRRTCNITKLLNCYLRETGSGEWITEDERMKSIFSNTLNRDTVPTYLCCRLSAQNVTLYGEVIYKSSTDRHLFGEQFYYQIGDSNSVITADYVTVITF